MIVFHSTVSTVFIANHTVCQYTNLLAIASAKVEYVLDFIFDVTFIYLSSFERKVIIITWHAILCFMLVPTSINYIFE